MLHCSARSGLEAGLSGADKGGAGMKKSFPAERRANRGGADEALGRQAFRRYAASSGIEPSLGFLCAMGVPFSALLASQKRWARHPSVLRRHCGPLHRLRRSARGTAVSGAVQQPLYRPSGCWRCCGTKFLPAPSPLPRQAGKPPEGNPSHYDHSGHRNAGVFCATHRSLSASPQMLVSTAVMVVTGLAASWYLS